MEGEFENESLIGFLRGWCKRKVLRLHVPGHQGCCSFLNKNLAARFDITEVDGADWLFASCGVLANLEQKLAAFFKSGAAISTCGSTLCVQTMVALCRNKIFIAYRNSAHVSFFNICAVLGVKVCWVGSCNNFGLSQFDLDELETCLAEHEKGSCALYLTSPDYFGICAPIKAIVSLCEKWGALCLVDCAHGAHLNCVEKGSYPADLGADLCCCSLHKTLPALTGAAVLNFNERLFSKARVKAAMSMFSTTSPSYLIMASIDFCVNWLEKHGSQGFLKLLKRKQNLIKKLRLPFLENDVSKLVIDCRKINLNGLDIAKILRANEIEPEFADENFVIMVLSPFLRRTDWLRLKRCLAGIEFEFVEERADHKARQQVKFCSNLSQLRLVTEIEEHKTELIDLNEKAVGRISAKTKFKSPPGTVIVAAGERLSLAMVDELKRAGVQRIEVLLN